MQQGRRTHSYGVGVGARLNNTSAFYIDGTIAKPLGTTRSRRKREQHMRLQTLQRLTGEGLLD